MVAEYKCKCNNTIEYKKKYGKDFPKTIKCNKCGKRARKDLFGGNIIVPFHMKSTSA